MHSKALRRWRRLLGHVRRRVTRRQADWRRGKRDRNASRRFSLSRKGQRFFRYQVLVTIGRRVSGFFLKKRGSLLTLSHRLAGLLHRANIVASCALHHLGVPKVRLNDPAERRAGNDAGSTRRARFFNICGLSFLELKQHGCRRFDRTGTASALRQNWKGSALRCFAMPERLLWHDAPETLAARPIPAPRAASFHSGSASRIASGRSRSAVASKPAAAALWKNRSSPGATAMLT